MEALRVENLSRRFGGLLALDGVSFAVASGERLGIIGPNGAGKTTLFQIVSGIIRPSEGRVLAYERDITNMPAHGRAAAGIGRTFQITNLFMQLSVLENIVLALQAHSRAKYNLLKPFLAYDGIVLKAEELLLEWGLAHRAAEPVETLAYGEQRQLEIILALAQEPSILLLDEPTCGLSPEEADKCVSVLQSLSRSIALVLIDHDMDVLFSVVDRVVVMHFGSVVADGRPDEVKADSKVQQIYMGAVDEYSRS